MANWFAKHRKQEGREKKEESRKVNVHFLGNMSLAFFGHHVRCRKTVNPDDKNEGHE